MIIGRLGDQPIYRTAVDEAVRLQVKEESRMEGQEKFCMNVHGGKVRPVELKDWVHPSQRTPGGKVAWEESLAEVKHFSEIADEEARREEAEYKAREEASEAEWDRRLAQRVAEGPVKFGGLTHTERKHYGVWHRERGWLVNGQQEIIVSTSRAVAVAQCDTARRCPSDFWNASLYEVRCIEEWAEKGHDDG